MKKAVFTIQVFGLIAMFPVYMAAELSHGNGRLAINNPSSDIIKKPAKKNMQPKLNSVEENADAFLLMSEMNLY